MTQILNLVNAIDSFITGCKSDGTWTSIKASCIMAGWSNLSGALAPLVGVAPSGFNLASGTYSRVTGLKGDGAAMYLNSNRNNNADPQNSKHISVYATAIADLGTQISCYAGVYSYSNPVVGAAVLYSRGTEPSGTLRTRLNSSALVNTSGAEAPGLMAVSRASSSIYTIRGGGFSVTSSQTSVLASGDPISIFALYNRAITPILPNDIPSNSRLSFYSIGESLDLALLDARVSGLMVAISGAIS